MCKGNGICPVCGASMNMRECTECVYKGAAASHQTAEVSPSNSSDLLCDLRAAVDLAAKALERDKNRPARQEIAAELRRTFGAVWEKHN